MDCFTYLIFLMTPLTVFMQDPDIRVAHYVKVRRRLINREFNRMVGGDVKLSKDEKQASDLLNDLRNASINVTSRMENGTHMFHDYFSLKQFYYPSKLFLLIGQMPKGALLHVHEVGMLQPDLLVGFPSKIAELMNICFDPIVKIEFNPEEPPSKCRTKWIKVKEMRKNGTYNEEFEKKLRHSFTLQWNSSTETSNNKKNNTKKDEHIKEYFNVLKTISDFMRFKPAFLFYLREALRAFLLDQIYYVEIRTDLPQLYDIKTIKKLDEIHTAEIYQNVSKEFKRKHDDFIGLRIIYTPKVAGNLEELKKQLALASKVKSKFPKIFAGFDQLDEFNKTTPLSEFAVELEKQNMSYFFHSGDTRFNSAKKDNIFDALALRSKRVGIAYSLPKHPVAEKMIKSREIGLEICVISNYIWQMVHDFRQHLLSYILANNLPVVLGSDRPGIWDSYPLSEDFYITWFAIMNRMGDIKPLKQLGFNSIVYSSMTTREKHAAYKVYAKKWREFINYVNLETMERNGTKA